MTSSTSDETWPQVSATSVSSTTPSLPVSSTDVSFKSFALDMERGVFHTTTIRGIGNGAQSLEARLTPNFAAMFNDSILESHVFSRLYSLKRTFLNEKNLSIILSIIVLINESNYLTLPQLKELYSCFINRFACCDLDQIVEQMEAQMSRPKQPAYRMYERPWF